jgi:hypothetical protein
MRKGEGDMPMTNAADDSQGAYDRDGEEISTIFDFNDPITSIPETSSGYILGAAPKRRKKPEFRPQSRRKRRSTAVERRPTNYVPIGEKRTP